MIQRSTQIDRANLPAGQAWPQPFQNIGEYWCETANGQAGTTTTGSANRLDLAPYLITRAGAQFDRIGIAISVGSLPGTFLRLLIYDNNAGLPSNLLVDSGDLPADGATVFVEAAISFTAPAGLIFVGVHTESNPTLFVRSSAGSPTMWPNTLTSTAWTNAFRILPAYTSGAPNPIPITAANAVSITPPRVLLRVAA